MDPFDALADPLRRDLLLRLAQGSARVVDLTADHAVTRPAISRHLRILGEAGLVRATPVGRERHYSLDRAPLAHVSDFLDQLTRPQVPITNHHLDALDTETRRARRDRQRFATTPARPKEQTA